MRSSLHTARSATHSSLRIAVRQRVLEEDVSVVNPMISSEMRCVHGVENLPNRQARRACVYEISPQTGAIIHLLFVSLQIMSRHE